MAELFTTPLYSDANLQAYWRLNSSNLDETANNNDLTLTGGSGYATGKYSNGLLCVAASNQGAQAADSASLSITGSMSLATWVNFSATPSSGNSSVIASKFNTTANQRSFIFRLENSGGTLRLYALIDQSGDAATQDVYTWNWTPTSSTWYHLALTVTPGNASATTFEAFINGVSQGNGSAVTSNNASGIFNSTSLFSIGTPETGAGGNLDATVDDLAVFNDILTLVEIQSLAFDLPGGYIHMSV